MSTKIRLHGIEYWFLGTNLDHDGAIAYLDHCDENGDIINTGIALVEDSYAHYFPEHGIMRYKKKIGDREDIEIIK